MVEHDSNNGDSEIGSALDLFVSEDEQGNNPVDAVLNRMRTKVVGKLQEVLQSRNKKSLLRRYDLCSNVSEAYIVQLIEDPGRISLDTFYRLCPSLPMTIHDILGKPHYRDEDTRDYWQSMIESHPPVIVDAQGSNETPNIRGPSLDAYVTSVAIHELQLMGLHKIA